MTSREHNKITKMAEEKYEEFMSIAEEHGIENAVDEERLAEIAYEYAEGVYEDYQEQKHEQRRDEKGL